MPQPVVVIGLDALEPRLLERWVADGELPFLACMFAQGTYARQRNVSLYRTENSWLTLLQGCSPQTGQEWGHQSYEAGEYAAKEAAAYTFHRYAPFYALRDKRRVAVFDIPLVGLVPHVNGVQLLGWGTEVNQILRQSQPPGLMAEMIRSHGRHPLYDTITNADDGSETLSYRIPVLYDADRLRSVRDQLLSAVRQRTAIIRDLMDREPWDLLFCTYGEAHTAGHLFWHLGREHPLAELYGEAACSDYLLEVVKEIDRSLGDLLGALPQETDVVILSPHGMQANSLDLYAMLFLPELLYRWSTGNAAFQGGDAQGSPPPARTDYARQWRDEVWRLRTAHGEAVLDSPEQQEKRGDPLDWDPGNWYQRVWPKMKAFALPGYSEGLIRINVRGRDGPEGIAPDEFDRVCSELIALARELVDARTGQPIAADVVRVRSSPFEDGPELSPADLMVLWREDMSTDVADHPRFGRIGPVPYFRSGGHATEGFVVMRGQGFEPGRRREPVETADVTATLLHRLGVSIPEHVEGKPIGLSAIAVER